VRWPYGRGEDLASVEVLDRAGVEPEPNAVDERLEVFREFVTRWALTLTRSIGKAQGQTNRPASRRAAVGRHIASLAAAFLAPAPSGALAAVLSRR